MGASKITAALIKRICTSLELAVPLKYACAGEGVSESTAYEWLAKAKEGDETYIPFADAVNRSQAKAVTKLHRAAIAGGKGSSGATWLLEKRFRKDYGSESPPVEDNEPLRIEQRRLNPERVPVDSDGRAIAQGDPT